MAKLAKNWIISECIHHLWNGLIDRMTNYPYNSRKLPISTIFRSPESLNLANVVINSSISADSTRTSVYVHVWSGLSDHCIHPSISILYQGAVCVPFYGIGSTRLCQTPALHASLSSGSTPARPQLLTSGHPGHHQRPGTWSFLCWHGALYFLCHPSTPWVRR